MVFQYFREQRSRASALINFKFCISLNVDLNVYNYRYNYGFNYPYKKICLWFWEGGGWGMGEAEVEGGQCIHIYSPNSLYQSQNACYRLDNDKFVRNKGFLEFFSRLRNTIVCCLINKWASKSMELILRFENHAIIHMAAFERIRKK